MSAELTGADCAHNTGWAKFSREITFQCDAQGVVTWGDDNAQHLLGLSRGAQLQQRVGAGDQEKLNDFLRRSQTKALKNWELAFRLRDQTRVFTFFSRPATTGISVFGIQMPDNYGATVDQLNKSLESMAELNRKLTQQRRKLEQSNAQLQDALRALSQAKAGERVLRHNLESKIQLLQERDEFLSTASHELKTPLTSLLLQIASFRRTWSQLSSGSLEHKCERMEKQIRRMGQLVDILLDVSRIRSGRMQLSSERVDLVELTHRVLETLKNQADGAGSRLDLVAPPTLWGEWDRVRVEQIVSNIVSNAIKYGEGNPIFIRLAEGGDQEVSLSVTDQGVGIRKDDLKRIFDRFERAGAKQTQPGLGLGLWIVRQIVETFGGRIEVKSAPGQGATFKIILPKSLQPSPSTTAFQ